MQAAGPWALFAAAPLGYGARMTSESLPVVRLKPKADARAIRHGAPWVYADDLVLDRRTKAIPSGAVVRLEDGNRAPLGIAGFNPGSKIAARLLDRDIEAEIDVAWFKGRIEMALSHREKIYADPYFRLIHAEADGLPGVIVDRFGDTLSLQPNAAWAEARLDMLAEALVSVTGGSTVFKNSGGRARTIEGLDGDSKVLVGKEPDLIPVRMNGATYMADLIGGQKTGLFFDQRPNHAFAAGLSKGGRVLDVFSHVGGFGLAALAAGASEALAVDGSEAALDLARKGAEISGVIDRFAIERGDAFAVMERLDSEARRFDLVVADPPAFAPSKKALGPGLRAYERVARLAANLVETGGYLVLCSCSHAADLAKFRAASVRGVGRAGRRAQLVHVGHAGPDHPEHPALPESNYLKALFFRVVA